MTIQKRDPLLTALRVIVYIIMGVMAFAAVVVLISAPFLLIAQGEILAELAEKGITGQGWPIIGVLFGVLIGIAVLLCAALYFFRLLLKITDTVRDGDPFTPENAERLGRMGWTVVAGYVVTAIIGVPGAWLASLAQEAGEPIEFSADLGGGGLVLILVLFVLARVFRHGTAMRDDLEGTI